MNQLEIGNFIYRKRKEKGLTQEQLAELLDINPKSISRWETGKNLPDTVLLKPLAHALDVSVEEILKGQEIEERVDPVGLSAKTEKRHSSIRAMQCLLVFSGLLFLDVMYGYMSANLNWTITRGRIHTKGIVFSLIFSKTLINEKGIILTKMFHLFVFSFAVFLLLGITYFILNKSIRRRSQD